MQTIIRRRPLGPILALAITAGSLAACDVKVDDKSHDETADNGADAVASLQTKGDKTEVSIPGIGTTISVPKFNIANGHVDLDGMKLYPGSEIVTMDVRDSKKKEDGGGSVRLTFTSADGPAAIAAYYRAAAAGAGYTVDPAGGDARVGAVKPDGKSFALQLDSQGSGARGTIILNDAS